VGVLPAEHRADSSKLLQCCSSTSSSAGLGKGPDGYGWAWNPQDGKG
jgi:hypothetical protein